MLFCLFICGVVLFAFSAYGIFKTGKGNNENCKKNKFLPWIALVLGAAFIIIPRCVWKTEELRAEKNVSLNWNIIKAENIDGNVDEQIIKQILNSFTERAVPLLKKYPNCVESATAVICQWNLNDKYLIYRQEEYGWGIEIEVSIKIKDDVTVRDGKYLLSGHTLWYYLGGGKRPGIDCLKSESAIFVGVDSSRIKDGENTFISVPEYYIIDQLVN